MLQPVSRGGEFGKFIAQFLNLQKPSFPLNPKISFPMLIEPPLSEMSHPEKLELLEALWDDLTRKQEEFDSPAWHEEVLNDCRLRAETGEEKFTDWEVAKEDIRRRVS